MSRLNPLSIRWLVPLLVVLPILLVVVGLGVPTVLMVRHVSEELCSSVMDSASDGVNDQVRSYLGEAVHVSDLYARRIHNGALDTGSALALWEPFMHDDLRSHPNVAGIAFGNEHGDATWLHRGAGGLEVGRADGARAAGTELPIDEAGHVGPIPLRRFSFDPRQRPWYSSAVHSQAPVWSPVYAWIGQTGGAATTATSYARAIRDPQGHAVGALSVSVTLDNLSEFLHRSRLTNEGGQIFILDEQDNVIAAAQGPAVAPGGGRLPINAAPNPGASALAPLLAEYRALPPSAPRPILATIALDGQPARARISPLVLYGGLRWRIITILPEAAFIEVASLTQRRVIAFSLLAAILGVVLGVRLSGQITGPLLRLAAFVRRVAGGDFDARLDLRAAPELREVSTELNEMAAGLKQRMALSHSLAVAKEVQQSLLPASDPAHDSLDVVGRSRYCDETGGDYYDLIDLAPQIPGAILIAVGDVMGHGIGAALLMASARAALRAHLPAEPRPAVLLNHLNRVLAADVRQERFMTMVLVRVSPEGVVTWANAGHDPTLIYLPGADQFEELEGGEIPLGLSIDVEYTQFERRGLPRGAVLFIGTDGIWEMQNTSNEMFGKDRLREVIRAHHARPAAQIAAALEAELSKFRAQRASQDDVTFVIVKIGGKEGTPKA